jgi:hypothetical protein
MDSDTVLLKHSYTGDSSDQYLQITGYYYYYYYYLISLALQPSAGYGLLVSRGFLITHNKAPQSKGLLLDE